MVHRSQEYAKITAEQIGDHAGVLTSEQLDILLGSANGWSYAELAERLKLNIGTVKSRLSRARVALAAARK